MKLLNLIPVLFLTVTGCVSVQPLSTDDIDRLKAGKTAVSTFDTTKMITYTNFTYYGLGVAQTNTTATYAGFFDLESPFSELFSKRFNDRGMKSDTKLLFTSMWTPDLVNIFSDKKRTMGGDMANLESKQKLPDVWRNHLLASGYDFMFLSVISGINITTTNFDTKVASTGIGADVFLYDVKKGSLAWSAILGAGFGAPIKDSPKEIENNDFALIREGLGKGIDLMFTVNAPAQKGIDVGMGLKPKPPQ